MLSWLKYFAPDPWPAYNNASPRNASLDITLPPTPLKKRRVGNRSRHAAPRVPLQRKQVRNQFRLGFRQVALGVV